MASVEELKSVNVKGLAESVAQRLANALGPRAIKNHSEDIKVKGFAELHIVKEAKAVSDIRDKVDGLVELLLDNFARQYGDNGGFVAFYKDPDWGPIIRLFTSGFIDYVSTVGNVTIRLILEVNGPVYNVNVQALILRNH